MGAQRADSTYPLVGDTGLVKTVEDRRKGKMHRCGPLDIIEEHYDIHPRLGQVFNAWRTNGIIKGTGDFLFHVITTGAAEQSWQVSTFHVGGKSNSSFLPS